MIAIVSWFGKCTAHTYSDISYHSRLESLTDFKLVSPWPVGILPLAELSSISHRKPLVNLAGPISKWRYSYSHLTIMLLLEKLAGSQLHVADRG